MTCDDIPACVCDAHPAGDDKRKYMVVAEENAERVVFCCRRCTEITGTPVIQVRTTPRGRERASYLGGQRPEEKAWVMRQLAKLRQRRAVAARLRREDD